MSWKWAALLFCISLPALAAKFTDALFVREIHVQGTEESLTLETKVGQALDRRVLARDMRRLWQTGSFDDIQVAVEETPEGAEVVFSVVEKAKLALRKVMFEPDDKKRPVMLEPGTPVDVTLAREMARSLRRHLVEEGHPDAKVQAELIPVGSGEADIRMQLETGSQFHLQDVRFTGDLRFPEKRLRREMRALRGQNILPGVPGVWKGWQARPPYSMLRLQADMESLRSFYIARGYLDAVIRFGGADFDGDRATATIDVQAGPRYGVRKARIVGTPSEVRIPKNGGFPAKSLCRCLHEARRDAEKEGRPDFSVRLEVDPAGAPPEWAQTSNGHRSRKRRKPANELPDKDHWVSLTAKVEIGDVYRVGKIEFRGLHDQDDETLRKAMVIEEGDLFDLGKLRHSLARLSSMGLLEPVTEASVLASRDPDQRKVDLTLAVKDAKRGRWSLSGPLGPMSLGGPLYFSVGSRLPGWGRGALRVSTYFLDFGLFSFPQILLTSLSTLDTEAKTKWQPLVGFSRPQVPGQFWQSGFTVSPFFGWRATAANYGLSHVRTAVRGALKLRRPPAPRIAVGLARTGDSGPSPSPFPSVAGSLFCAEPKPRLAWARSLGARAVDWVLAVPFL